MPGALPHCVGHCCSLGPFAGRKCNATAAAISASLGVQAGFKLDESEAPQEGGPLPLFA